MELSKILPLIIIIVFIIIIIIIVIKPTKSGETYVPSRLNTWTAKSVAPNVSTSQQPQKSLITETKTHFINGDKPVLKEGFFNTGVESVSVNEMGTLEGPTIFTNGQLANGLTYDKIVDDVKKSESVSDGVMAGAGRGTGFEDIYQEYMKNQAALDQAPTGVRSMEEMQELTKSINGNLNMAKNNMMTRAGASKAKIVLDPNGTVGVMEDGAALLPERERNHKIYATSHVIQIPGYKMDYVDMYNNVIKASGEAGFSKAMSVDTENVITGFGQGAVESSQITDIKPSESFSETY